jgi:hypothetical protein
MPDQVRIVDPDSPDELSLLDILDHVLNSGIVVHGSLVISLAGVDLVYVGLNAVVTSVETALRHLPRKPSGSKQPLIPAGVARRLPSTRPRR